MNQLYPHQRDAVEWLVAHPRGGLFDDQGLGKTIEVIVAADRLQARRVLVVAPTVAVLNWVREWQRWSPGRVVQTATTGSVRLDPTVSVVVVTHGLLLDERIADQLRGFDLVVVDEAHAFRNPTAKRTRVLYLGKDAIARRAPRCWALTGTPMPNNPTELWAMVAGLDPERLRHEGKLLSYQQFRSRFCVCVPSGYGNGIKVIGATNVPELRRRLAGFSLRRRKDEVLNLPAMRFGTVLLDTDAPIWMPDDDGDAYASLGRDDETLASVTSNPAFSTWRKETGLAKVDRAVELLTSDLNGGSGKFIVVAHHREVIDQIRDALQREFGIHAVETITGDSTPRERQAAVDAFQNNGQCRVIVLQIQAGGVAITLTAATDVVFVEQSFVPGENAQVMDRAHRIGQTKSVLVRYLASRGLDEILVEILARKTQMIRQVLQ